MTVNYDWLKINVTKFLYSSKRRAYNDEKPLDRSVIKDVIMPIAYAMSEMTVIYHAQIADNGKIG